MGDHGPSGVAAVGQPCKFLSVCGQIRDDLEEIVCRLWCVVAVYQRPVCVDEVQGLLRQSGDGPAELELVLAGGPTEG